MAARAEKFCLKEGVRAKMSLVLSDKDIDFPIARKSKGPFPYWVKGHADMRSPIACEPRLIYPHFPGAGRC